jgi:hypothetical protein
MSSSNVNKNENHPDQEIEDDITTLLQNILPIKYSVQKRSKKKLAS